MNSADASQLEDTIQKEYEKRLRRHPDAALGWRLLYSPRNVLSGARVAFVGLNPGGRTIDPTHGEFSTEAGSAYRKEIEDWGPSTSLQDQVMALFERLDVVPEEVLAGNLVPFRSPSEDSLPDAPDAIAFGRNLWKQIFGKVRPSLVVSMGRTSNREISSLLMVRDTKKHLIGWGNYTASRASFEGGDWIGLPHLSRFAIMKRDASQAALNELFNGLDRPRRPRGDRSVAMGFDRYRTTDRSVIKESKKMPRFQAHQVIRLTYPGGNPKKPGSLSYERFRLYRDGMTVQEYGDAVIANTKYDRKKAHEDLKWDEERGFIRIT